MEETDMTKKLCYLLIVLILLLTFGSGCSANNSTPDNPPSNTSEEENIDKIPELTIASSPGPMSYPLAYMAENDVFANIAEKTTLTSWTTGDQLRAMVTSNQVQFAVTPITNAFMLYNKDVDVKLINVAVWGILYVMSSDENLKTIEQLKGKEIAIAGKGGIHDLIFRHLLIKHNIDPEKDIKITYMDMSQASTSLLTGSLQYAILNEPNSSAVLANAKKEGLSIYRSLDLQEEWASVTGNPEARIPWAGLIVVGENANNHKLVNMVVDQFASATKWVLENPQQAGEITEKYFQNMKVPAVANSIPFSRLDPKPASECQKLIEDFFQELMTTAPMEAIGGKIPDAGLYYQGQ